VHLNFNNFCLYLRCWRNSSGPWCLL